MHSAAENVQELVAARLFEFAIAGYCLLSAIRVGILHGLLGCPVVHRHRRRSRPLGTIDGGDRVDTSL